MSYSRPQRDASDVVDTGRTNYSAIQLPEPSSSSGNENNNTVNLEFIEEKYKTNHAKRGIAVIFNQVNFVKNNMRDGSDKDCESMRMALEKFSLEVLVRKDFTKSQIKEELENLAKMDHSKNDCFVLVILTHGSPNQLYAKDDKFDVSLLWENFVGSKCESLIGKPKLFFIQACRGTKFDNGAPQPSLPPNATTGADASSFTIPSTGDILVMYATFEGYYAFRNQENGSNFIQTLSKTLLENGSKVELKKLLKYVQRQIALKFISNNPNEPESHQKKQMPCIVSTLTKDFYFTKKDIVELDTAKASV